MNGVGLIEAPRELHGADAEKLSGIPRFKAWRTPFKDAAARRVPYQRFETYPIGIPACESLNEASEVAVAVACDHKDGLLIQEFDSKLGHHVLHVFTIKRQSSPIRYDWDRETQRRRPVFKCYADYQHSYGLRSEFNPREAWVGGPGSDPVGLDRDRPASERLVEVRS